MAATNWKVKLFIVDPAGKAEHKDNFGVNAKNHDEARLGAQEWLTTHGYRVRSVNFSTSGARDLIAYADQKKGAAQ